MEPKELINIALKAREYAHAPYSNFKVGAAILSSSGKVYTGSNVESSSYGLTICAERVALVKALSEGETDFESIAVVSVPGASLCGACRQLLWDYTKDIPVYLSDLKMNIVERNLSVLLPYPFDNSQLVSDNER
ncbi:MAG: cytidine deaminase [Candidatus Marinimicrobia bacterium]|nr:cytidine deaminase [Candidatus Neomarinimicrobiota bacterium]